ncbi:MAG: rod shape-determining protein [Bacilli bacterium]|nr:rod shape-determining protein [Bacilli bacterium]
MEKPVAALEFGSKKMKLVIGYELNGQVYVLYALTRPYGHMIEGGNFVDISKVTQCVKEIKNFTDPSAELKLSISEVLLALPPYGLQIFTSQQITTVVGDDGCIGKIDIRNVHALIRNGQLPFENELIDIVPVFYELDQGTRFIKPPLGQQSSTVRVGAMVHTLPKHINKQYAQALLGAGINVKRQIVAPFAACELLGSYQDVPNDYILVDIGATMTTVSLVGEKRLYGSVYFPWGGDNITEKIMEVFNVNEVDAEKFKITYGLDNREMNFKAPICRVTDEEGNETKHYADELNQIIKEELSIFVKDLNASLEQLLQNYDPSLKKSPMILVGGGSQLYGLENYLAPKVESDDVHVIAPRNLGARDATYTNCLGLILANASNPTVYDENHPRVGQLTRDEN